MSYLDRAWTKSTERQMLNLGGKVTWEQQVLRCFLWPTALLGWLDKARTIVLLYPS